MGKAEFGTPKYVANKMKAKGLQRLRWYCQVCEKQCRDENGFKCHVQSEAHTRQMNIVGENPNRHIEQYSRQFKHDFLLLLRSSHGEKKINSNRFYQEYISNKSHIHMNGTRWKTLTEFVKSLGREGLCRVSEDDKDGLCLAWIDNSPDKVKGGRDRLGAVKGDEHISNLLLQRQIDAAERLEPLDSKSDACHSLERRSAVEPIRLDLPGATPAPANPTSKRVNPFKTHQPSSGPRDPGKPYSRPANAFERIIRREQRHH